MTDEIELLEEKEYDMMLSGDRLSDIKRIISENPVPSDEENRELARQYQSGDMDAPQKLINKNMRLILWCAKKFVQGAKSFDLLDLINEGAIGFIEGLDKYDPTRANLSTYLVPRIEQAMRRSLGDNDEIIRRPVHIVEATKKYNRVLANRAKTGEPEPTDEEWCEILKVSMGSLSYIKNNYLYNPTSMDQKVGEDSETEFSNFVGTEDKRYDDILNSIADKELLIFLKEKYKPTYYYILYYRVFSDEKPKLEDIGRKFGITRERVRQIEAKRLEELRILFTKGKKLYAQGLASVRQQFDVDKYDVSPVDIEKIFTYLFLRDDFTDEERLVYRFMMEKKYLYTASECAKILGMSLENFMSTCKAIEEKVTEYLDKFRDLYVFFKKSLLKEYTTNITTIDLDISKKKLPVDYRYVVESFDGYTYEEFMRIYEGPPINSRMDNLLGTYFGHLKEENMCTIDEAEREVNALIFGFNKRSDILLDKLYDTLLKNRSRFSEEQYDYLMAYKFNRMKRQEFHNRYPNASTSALRYFYRVLERLYFNFTDYNEYNFSKEKYLEIRDRCKVKMENDAISILDMFYGVDTEAVSIGDIANKLGLTYDKAHSLVRHARETALGVYIGKSSSLEIDSKLYIPYLYDIRVVIENESREIARLYLEDNLDYGKISEMYKMSRQGVSNIITEVIRKIDFYRFGILSLDSRYTKEELKYALDHINMDEASLMIVREVLSNKAYGVVGEEYGVTIGRIRGVMNRFYQYCHDIKLEEVDITRIEEIENGVRAHISESVLSDKQKCVLSFVYGISYEGNPKGEKLSLDELSTKLGESVCKLYALKKSAMNTLKAQKVGLAKPTIGYMSRNEVAKVLEDRRVPISRKERKYLCHYFELEGYNYLDINGLASKYGEGVNSIKRRIQRAFVSIFKYLNGEEPGKLSYELDVVPNLKYFCKKDQSILIGLYEEELSYRELGERCGLTYAQIVAIVDRIRIYLQDLLNEKVSGFDFNFFYDSVDSDEIPFYGDKELAKRMFILYYENRMSTDGIIEELDLKCGSSTVLRIIEDLMIAVLKYREGIKKEREFSYEEIREYYLKHSEEMIFDHKVYYFRYFERMKKERQFHYVGSIVPAAITLDLIKDRNENWFDLSKVDRNTVLRFLRTDGRSLTRKSKNTLAAMFNISSRELMSGSEQMKVLNFLGNTNLRTKSLVLQDDNS